MSEILFASTTEAPDDGSIASIPHLNIDCINVLLKFIIFKTNNSSLKVKFTLLMGLYFKTWKPRYKKI
jgi:hypothetical protein